MRDRSIVRWVGPNSVPKRENKSSHDRRRSWASRFAILLCAGGYPLCYLFCTFYLFQTLQHQQSIESSLTRQIQPLPGNATPSSDESTVYRRLNVSEYPVQIYFPMIPGTSSQYAYSFLLGAIHEDRPAYKGFLYNIAISVSLLKQFGSTADFWLWYSLASDSALESLPEDDMRLLSQLGVHMEQMEKPDHDSFAHLVFGKFRTLQMTSYRRVMFLDADVMPLSNLDYLFRLSDQAKPFLRPNFVMASRAEPCQAGVFMVEPQPGRWDEVQKIIKRQREEGMKLEYPHFSYESGWGHNFREAGDHWEAVRTNGTLWNFHASHSDQGLLYFYLKYVLKDVSLFIGDRIKNCVQDEETYLSIKDLSPLPIAHQSNCGIPGKEDPKLIFMCSPLYRDFAHFFGDLKPWQSRSPRKYWKTREGDLRNWTFDEYDQVNKNAAYRVWWTQLAIMNDQFTLGLDISHWMKRHKDMKAESPLGYMAMYKDEEELLIQNLTKINVTVAYAISFIKCGDFQTHSAGLTDAALVLRHSVHKIHLNSKYDYKMYAIVHRQAESCSSALQEMGFDVVVVDSPVQDKKIRGEYLRKHIKKEWCCGSDEFIKLYAYTLPHPVIVHVDIDFAFYKPMDHLFDALIYGKDTFEGQSARRHIELERPTETLPDEIGAFITRDWPQVAPNKFPPGYQAGFLVARRDQTVFDEMVSVIKQGNYTEGWGWTTGWGGKGYGGYVGAMAMQGLVAYYYDYIRPNNAVELNQCRFNHMGMDVLYRKQPNFNRKYAKSGVGACRNGNPTCEDCMTTGFNKIYSVHYTMCRKPWQCMATGAAGGKKPGGSRASAINTDTVHLDHCLGLVKQWHLLRADLENKLYNFTHDETILQGRTGDYRNDIFQGHCKEDGNDGYMIISGKEDSFRRLRELYIT